MALKLYRRHRQACEAKQPEDSRTGEFEEGRRGWKKCGCIIHAVGTLGGKFNRKQTGKADWDEAKQVAAAWERARSWHDSAAVEAPSSVTPLVPVGMTTKAAITTFLRDIEPHAATNTQKKYRLLLKKLDVFSQDHGLLLLSQWGPSEVRELRSSWDVSLQTSAKNMSTIKAFFEFCHANEWLPRNPARLVKNQRGRDAADRRHEQKLPFTDDELRRMYDACDNTYGKKAITWSRTSHDRPAQGELARYYTWTGQDLADFISVSVYTGLRISDVSTFHIDRLQSSGEITVRTTKAGTNVATWIPEWLQERLRERAATLGPYVFGEHQTKDVNVITDGWRRKLNRLWSLCGPWNEKPTPHRFRHTFARILLQRPGITIRDVAELLGNTEHMVRKHYAAWIPERQERLTAVLKAAFQDTPRPHEHNHS